MKRLVRNLFILAFLCFGFLLNNNQVSAADVYYHAYKYGTHENSMAVGYYAQPAQVVADGNQYLVTMTIRTKKSLSPWPVEVISVAGQAPINVVKTRHGSDYDYRYSFKTANLKADISSKIKIDVPNVYRATHMISFAFDRAALPKLTGKKQVVRNDIDQKVTTSKSNNNSVANSELIVQAKRQSQAVAAKQKQLAHDQLLLNKKNQAANEHNQKMFYYTIFGGIISSLILVAAAVLLILKIHKDQKRDR